MRFSNPTGNPIEVEVNALDATTASNGGTAFDTTEIEPSGVGLWIRVDKSLVTIPSGADIIVGFSVEVPQQIEPGQYLAGISASESPSELSSPTSLPAPAAKTSASVTTRIRYVIAVEIDISGAWTPSLKIDDISVIQQPSGPVIGLKLRNDGATFLHPRGTLIISGSEGSTKRSIEIDIPTFVTGTEVTFPVSWQGTISPGSYTAVLNLNYGDDQIATYSGEIVFSDPAINAVSITVDSFTVTAHVEPTTGAVQYAEMSISIGNPGTTVTKGQLRLHVERDGVLVEDFLLGTDLTFPEGSAQIQQRYLPFSGWVSGMYTFRIDLQTTDSTSGTVTTLTSATATSSLVID